MKIKKVFTILVGIITLQLAAQAPVTPDYAKAIGSFKIGIKGGANLSTQKASIDVPGFPVAITTSNISSFHVGVYGELRLNEKATLIPEILYTQEGSMVNLEAIAFKQKVNYIKVPLLFSYTIFTEGLSLHIGPQFGFMVKDVIELDNNDGDPFIDADFKSFEFSSSIGAEYKISQKFKVGARYNLGLSDISNSDEGTFKNRNLQFYVGLNLF
jgi:hypothetical protein